MKNIFTVLFLLITTIAVAQPNYKCIPYNYNTPWTQLYEIPTDSLQRIANHPIHFHTWKYEDVGDNIDWEYDMEELSKTKPDCGYTTVYTERRICAVCSMFEERKHTVGQKRVYFTTAFDSLKMKFYQQHDPYYLLKQKLMYLDSTLHLQSSDTLLTDNLINYLPNDHK